MRGIYQWAMRGDDKAHAQRDASRILQAGSGCSRGNVFFGGFLPRYHPLINRAPAFLLARSDRHRASRARFWLLR